MKFVFFSVSENGENGLGDEGAGGGNAARIFGLEPFLENAFVRGSKSNYPFPSFAPIFHPHNAFSVGRSKHH